MIEHLTGDDLYANVLFMRTGTSAAILLVEGESDSKALSPHVDPFSVLVTVGYGRKSVEQAIELANTAETRGVIALLDSDLTELTGSRSASRNVVYTEHHDLEADIFLLPTMADRLIHNFSDMTAFRAHAAEVGSESTVDLVCRIAATIGLIRLVSQQAGLQLSLGDLPFDSFVDRATGFIDSMKLAAIVKGKSKDARCTAIEIDNLVTLACNFDRINIDVCRGHDLAHAAGAAIRGWWGGKAANAHIENSLRAMLSCGDLSKTRLFHEFKSWADQYGRRFWTCV